MSNPTQATNEQFHAAAAIRRATFLNLEKNNRFNFEQAEDKAIRSVAKRAGKTVAETRQALAHFDRFASNEQVQALVMGRPNPLNV